MAATNVQAFSGDVEITSNLAVDTNTLFVDSMGNKVGIGTTSPTGKLELFSTELDKTHIRVYADTPAETQDRIFELSDVSGSGLLQMGDRFNNDSTTYKIQLNTEGDSFVNGGNVGIGTTDPTGFEVYNKPINQTYRVDFTNIHVNNKYKIDGRDGAAPNTLSQRYGVRAADNAGDNPEFGELIIGAHADQNYTTSDGSFISFNDSGHFYIATHPTANYGEDVTLGSNQSYPYIGTNEDNRISPIFTVRPTGRVGIGTTDPKQLLEVHSSGYGLVRGRLGVGNVLTSAQNGGGQDHWNLGTSAKLVVRSPQGGNPAASYANARTYAGIAIV